MITTIAIGIYFLIIIYSIDFQQFLFGQYVKFVTR
jgi:hypothetical protein